MRRLKQWWFFISHYVTALNHRDFREWQRLSRQHGKCCKPAAEWLLANYTWKDGAFMSFGMTQAYGMSESLGCKVFGWQRQFVIMFFVFRKINWTQAKNASKYRVL